MKLIQCLLFWSTVPSLFNFQNIRLCFTWKIALFVSCKFVIVTFFLFFGGGKSKSKRKTIQQVEHRNFPLKRKEKQITFPLPLSHSLCFPFHRLFLFQLSVAYIKFFFPLFFWYLRGALATTCSHPLLFYRNWFVAFDFTNEIYG